MASSQQRELMAQIEQLGYTYRGHDKQNATIMWHPEGGAVRIHSTPSDNRAAMNKVSEARRKIRSAQARYGKFAEWLLKKHGVGDTEQKELRLNMRDLAREYVDENPDGGRVESLAVQVENDDRVEVLKRQQGSKTWTVRLTGHAYGLETAVEPTLEPEVERPAHLTPVNNGAPMEAVIDQLRHMMLEEVNMELDDLRAKHALTVETLTGLLDTLNTQPHAVQVVR